VMESNGQIRNGLTARLENMEDRPRAMTLAIEGLPNAKFYTDAMDSTAAVRSLPVTLPADATMPLRLYVTAPKGTAAGDFAFTLTSPSEKAAPRRATTRFITPETAP
jgi:polyferredoxin